MPAMLFNEFTYSCRFTAYIKKENFSLSRRRTESFHSNFKFRSFLN